MRQKQQKKKKKQRKHRRHSSDQSQRSRSRQQRSRHHKNRHHYRQQSPRKHKKRRRDESSSRQQRRAPKHERRQPEPEAKLENKQKQYAGWQSSPQRDPEGQPKSQFQNKEEANVNPEAPKKQQPNFEPSGILLTFYNAREGIALKFHEPSESHSPTDQWRIYPFKQNKALLPIILTKSCYLIGKDERICDILCENESISRQHAVIQFRSQYTMKIDGTYQMEVKPYIMDLQSTNGTSLNGETIQSQRYYELLEKDIVRFGLSDREYVMFKVPTTKSTNVNK